MKTEIDRFSPCREALAFRRQYPDFEAAWDNCPRGDWMLWIAKKLDVDTRKLTLAKGLCANTVIHLMKDQRSKDAVRAAIDYGNGLIDDKQLKDAADAAAYAAATDADAAAYAAATDAADAAAYAAATDAAAAAYVAAAAAADAAYVAAAAATDAAAAYVAAATDAAAAYVAAAAATDAAYATARTASRKQTADICREILTDEVMSKIKEL